MFQAVGRHKRGIGEHHDGNAVLMSNRVASRCHSIAGAQLFFLNGEGGAVEPSLYVFRARREHCHDAFSAGKSGGVHGPGQHCVPPDPVKRLWQGGIHPCTLAGGENDGGETHSVI